MFLRVFSRISLFKCDNWRILIYDNQNKPFGNDSAPNMKKIYKTKLMEIGEV